MNKNMVENKQHDRMTVTVLDKNGSPQGVVTVSRQCAYCDKPAKTYVWCREHLISMARLLHNTNKTKEVIS